MSKELQRRDAEKVAGVTSTKPELSKRQSHKNYYPVAGYRIRPVIKTRVDKLAEKLKVSNSELVEILFEFALDAYDKGDLKLELTPQKYAITRK